MFRFASKTDAYAFFSGVFREKNCDLGCLPTFLLFGFSHRSRNEFISILLYIKSTCNLNIEPSIEQLYDVGYMLYGMLRYVVVCMPQSVSNILFSNILPDIMTRFWRRGHARWTCYAYIVSSRHVYCSCLCLRVKHWEFSMHFALFCLNSIFDLLLSPSHSSHCQLSSN